jgi:hypothetical protein
MVTNSPEQIAAFTAALTSPEFAYTRARSWRLSGWVKDNTDYVVYAYRRDRKSPSGVSLMCTLNGLDEATAIIDSVGSPFPLSPTEGLRKS